MKPIDNVSAICREAAPALLQQPDHEQLVGELLALLVESQELLARAHGIIENLQQQVADAVAEADSSRELLDELLALRSRVH